MAEHDYTKYLPNWLSVSIEDIKNQLDAQSVEYLENFLKEFAKISDTISQLPIQTRVYEIYRIIPEELNKIFDDPSTALTHACEALIGVWSFQHHYKFRASFDGINYGLREGNLLLTASCARSMFEEMAHFHFFLHKIEASHLSIISLFEQELPRFRKRKEPSLDWRKKYTTAHLDIIQKLAKAIEGSDYNWNGWFESKLRKYDLHETEIAEAIKTHGEFRRTHINDCIRLLEERAKLDASKTYDLLSEMVHPNFGSNTLVIVTRKKLNDVVGELTLSSAPRNVEASAWFFQLLAEPLGAIFRIERECIDRSTSLLEFYKHMASSTANLYVAGMTLK